MLPISIMVAGGLIYVGLSAIASEIGVLARALRDVRLNADLHINRETPTNG